MDEDSDFKLKVYSKRSKRAPLIITDFSHGEVKNKQNGLKFECFKKSTASDNMGFDTPRELVATNGRLNYSGSSSQSALKYFVGVKSKSSGKMKLYDCVLFRMKPDINQMVNNGESIAPKSYWEGMNDLTQNFGSKAKKRALNTLQKCAVDALDKSVTVDESAFRLSPDRSINDETHHQIDYLPPQDRNAAIPSEVFDLGNIISAEEDIALNREAQELLIASASQFDEKSASFCKYVASRFHNVDDTKAKLLLYYNYLIAFQQLKYADIRKKDPAPHIPNPHKKHILEKFTLSSSNDKGRVSRTCPNQMKDKLLAYVLVLALYIDDFKINLDELQIDFNNVSVQKLKTIAEVLGCHTGKNKIGDDVANYAELRIPLSSVAPKFSKKPSSRRF